MRPKGSAAKLEARRRLAAKLLSRGKGIREVARRIGAAPSSVKRWKDALDRGGASALKSKPHTGRPARLSAFQRRTLLQILRKGPQASNLRAEQWTCKQVCVVIRKLFGIRYHPDHVSRILRNLGWRNRSASASRLKGRRSTHLNRRWGGPRRYAC